MCRYDNIIIIIIMLIEILWCAFNVGIAGVLGDREHGSSLIVGWPSRGVSCWWIFPLDRTWPN